MITSIGTYLPTWGSAMSRQVGLDEDAVTLGVAAGLGALAGGDVSTVRRVVFVSRDLPLLEGGNAAPLLAGLGLPHTLEVREQIGGAPAALDAVLAAADGTLVIAADIQQPAGAAAVLCGAHGVAAELAGRVVRNMPVATRDAYGNRSDYADPRLLRVRGVGASLDEQGIGDRFTAVAGLGAKDAASLFEGAPDMPPTTGASSALFALAALAESGQGGRLLAVDQAAVTTASIDAGSVPVSRDQPKPQPLPKGNFTEGPSISIALPAYDRAFDAKLRLEAAKCRTCGTLAYPHSYRCLECGAEDVDTDIVPLPRDAVIYSLSTIRVPVPGLTIPYTVVIAEMGDSGVRLLVKLTGAPPASVAIGDQGRMVFRLVTVRSGVPDYGYAFYPVSADLSTTGEVAK